MHIKMCGPFVSSSNWQKLERLISPVWARGCENRLFRMLLVGVQANEAFVAGNLALFIEIYYVFL